MKTTTLLAIRSTSPCIKGMVNLVRYMKRSRCDETVVTWADQRAANKPSFALYTLPEHFNNDQIERLRKMLNIEANINVREFGVIYIQRGHSEEELGLVLDEWEHLLTNDTE